jgi:hypothetical protein
MSSELKRKLRRWAICVGIAAVVYWLGPNLVMRSWQIGWHIAHRNQLKLSRSAYTVPLRWLVQRPAPSDALLIDAPPVVRTVTTAYISESGPKGQVALDRLLVLEQQIFVKNGELQRVRRLHTDAEETACLEGTLRALPGIYVVRCFGSSGMYSLFAGDRARVEAYYMIVGSAHPL